MLVLSRKKNQKIIIGNDIAITVLQINGSHVTLGIDAPDGVLVMREELLEKIKRENRADSKDGKEIEILLKPGKSGTPKTGD